MASKKKQTVEAMDVARELIASSKNMKLSYNGNRFTLTGTNHDDYKAIAKALNLKNKQEE